MPANKVAENVFGTLGTLCWTIQLMPQVWKSWKTKSTEGLSSWLVLLWALSGPFLGVYVVVQGLNIPLIVQPQLFAVLSLISWGQCQYYSYGRTKSVSVKLVCGLSAVLAGFEAGMVFALRPSYNDGSGSHRPVQFFGIVSSILISVALFPQYYEIYKHREVIGISLPFVTVDLLGGVFSDLSLAFKESFDVIASLTYSLVVVLDGLVILAAVILNPRARRRRNLAVALAATDPLRQNSVAALDM